MTDITTLQLVLEFESCVVSSVNPPTNLSIARVSVVHPPAPRFNVDGSDSNAAKKYLQRIGLNFVRGAQGVSIGDTEPKLYLSLLGGMSF